MRRIRRANGPKTVAACKGGTVRKRLGRLWHGTNQLVEKISSYIICFGPVRGCLLYISLAIRPSLSRRAILARVPGSELKLLVRPGTSDIVVFNDIFHGKEHEWTFAAPPDVILDAGAYTGLSAAYFAMRHPQARVIALEPGAENFSLLTRNVSSFKNIQAINGALWNESGMLIVTDPGRGSWGLTVNAGGDSGANKPGMVGEQLDRSVVRAFTMSDIMDEYRLDKVDLLKLDIEGSEKEVLSSSDSWISRVSAISVELHDRFKPGCSRAFFNAVSDFPIELRRGEKILVARNDSRISPLTQ
jgi:FkbM family methyltransferase